MHDLAADSDKFGEEGMPFFGGDISRGGGKAIKRAFAKNADHTWLATLDTVHWKDPYILDKVIKFQTFVNLNYECYLMKTCVFNKSIGKLMGFPKSTCSKPYSKSYFIYLRYLLQK